MAGAGRSQVSLRLRLGRWALLLTLVVTLAWLAVEEKSRMGTVIFALPWAALIVCRLRPRSPKPFVDVLVRSILAGALVGPLAALLMLVKVGVHGHPQPDYAVADVLAMLAWTPLGASLGALFGLGLGMIREAFVQRDPRL